MLHRYRDRLPLASRTYRPKCFQKQAFLTVLPNSSHHIVKRRSPLVLDVRSRMTQMVPGGSPCDYTVEITPDLNTVARTASDGWV